MLGTVPEAAREPDAREEHGPEPPAETGRPAILRAEAWRDMLRYLRPQRRLILVGGGLSLLGGFSGLIQPVIAKSVVENLESRTPVMSALIALTALVLVSAVVGAIGTFILMRVSESVVLSTRREVIRRVLWLRVSETDKIPPGDLMSRATADTTLMRSAVTTAIVETVNGSVMLVAILVLMGFMDWVLLLTTLAVVLLGGVLVATGLPQLENAARRAQEGVAELSTALERALGTFRTIKASGAEEAEAEIAERGARHAWQHSLKVARLDSLVGAFITVTIQVAFLAVLGVGGARVASDAMSLGSLIAFLLYLFYLVPPLGALVTAMIRFNVVAAAMSRVGELLRLRTEPYSPAPVRPVPGRDAAAAGRDAPVPASVTFEDVVFRYPGEGPVVHHGISFEVPAAGMTAFVGPSGAGKSTVFSLIERFYEPQGGTVRLDGRDIRDLDLGELRGAIGYVEQDAPVLAGTIRDNLCIGMPYVEEGELRRVVGQARLDGLVDRLPHGLDTEVGHRGTKLSGGERQRVAVARALLRRPRLLLLDEVTSQLDARNENALREVITGITAQTTVVVVAHRLSTVSMADRIVVMDGGRIRAVGTHEELLSEDALYRELAATQMLLPVSEPAATTVRANDILGEGP
ncbi:ATP-binding cassette domain-containing protein [Streptomyces sp. p1417]|uniref:ATP-binding cassette domain-containing protein n=1 Tax=Streptomyces typhae TaxID=2681492 RepID=A0A6L6WUN4_9ACTN|nr:ABC transporter ATP-binding protein [Streptomyces typhae]MVO85773.1 ATP-binding cassette domain-containing protein [Streptomyces typhae]